MPVDYRYLDSFTVSELAEKAVAVLPAGSLEQHCDSPLGLDALIAEKIAWLACEKVEERRLGVCVVLPALYYGFSPEWSRVAGTLTLSAETFISLVRDIIESLARSGFKRVAVVNGHYTNSGLLKAVLQESAVRLGVKTALVDYWRVSGIKLDHAGSVERAVAGALGIPVGRGDCSSVGAEEGIVTEPPSRPAVIDYGCREAPRVEEIVEAVASAIEKLWEDGGGGL